LRAFTRTLLNSSHLREARCRSAPPPLSRCRHTGYLAHRAHRTDLARKLI